MVTELIGHPELLNRDTLYELRRVVGQCPYYQAARLLLIENLFLLHDPDFDAELRAAALYVPDRTVLFQLIESIHYEVNTPAPVPKESEVELSGNRTLDLISQFLGQTPSVSASKRPSMPIDPINDYMSVLEAMEDAEPAPAVVTVPAEQSHGSSYTLVDDFLSRPEHRLQLNDEAVVQGPDLSADDDVTAMEDMPIRQEYCTETLARLFIKQGNYEAALDILTRLNMENPSRRNYMADQIRFLQKLIINQRHAKKAKGLYKTKQ